jgi:nitrate reductase NapD
MNVAGVLLQVHPDKLGRVRAALDRFPGVEVHMLTQDGRLIVTVEEEGEGGDTVLALHRLEGVLAASISYHHFEPEPEDDKDEDSTDATITA